MPKEKKEVKENKDKNKGGGPKNENNLTDKQQLFCEEYLIDLNATQAAIRAGYSEKTSSEMGYENLNKPQIAQYITYLRAKREKRTEVTSDRVVKELAKLAFFNMEDVIDERGVTKELTEWSRDDLAAIQEVTEDKLGSEEDAVIIRRKVKVSDKKASLELLARHLGIFNDKINIEGITFNMDYGKNEAD